MKDFFKKTEASSLADIYNTSLSDGVTSEYEAMRAIEAIRRVSKKDELIAFLQTEEDEL